MTDEERARFAGAVLENEVFQDICTEQEADAIRKIKDAASSEELLAARAQLVAVADIQKALRVLVDRPRFDKARSDKRPLA